MGISGNIHITNHIIFKHFNGNICCGTITFHCCLHLLGEDKRTLFKACRGPGRIPVHSPHIRILVSGPYTGLLCREMGSRLSNAHHCSVRAMKPHSITGGRKCENSCEQKQRKGAESWQIGRNNELRNSLAWKWPEMSGREEEIPCGDVEWAWERPFPVRGTNGTQPVLI